MPDIEVLVREIREMASMARASRVQWIPFLLLDTDGESVICNPPDDGRQVLVFLNGHVKSTDSEGRAGGGWGVRLGFFEHDKGRWSVRDRVTHWCDLPGDPDHTQGYPPLASECEAYRWRREDD